MPWENADGNVSPVGALSVFRVVIDEKDEWKF